MKVGDYVRTKRGIIGKIKLIDNQTELENLYLVKRKWYYKEDFIKSSPNIIDLIEVGDYVNGYEVTNKDKFLGFGNHDWYMTNDEIKSIVTKEQFKNIEYEVIK